MSWFGPLLEATQDAVFDPSVLAHAFSDRPSRGGRRNAVLFNPWQAWSFQAPTPPVFDPATLAHIFSDRQAGSKRSDFGHFGLWDARFVQAPTPPVFDPATLAHIFSDRTRGRHRGSARQFGSWNAELFQTPAPPAFDPSVLSWLTPFSARTRPFRQYRWEDKTWPETPFIPPPEPTPPARRVSTGGKKRHRRGARGDQGTPKRNRTYEIYESIRSHMQALLAKASPPAFTGEAPRYSSAEALLQSIEALRSAAAGEADLLYRVQALRRQIEAYELARLAAAKAMEEQLIADDDDFFMMM